MPYRRLPNTDAARIKALQIALDKGRDLPPFKLAFSQNAFQKVKSFHTSFAKAIVESKAAYDMQVEKNKDYLRNLKKAKLYISHFIQVLHMAIMRGEIPASERLFFQLAEDEKRTPELHTESEVIEWGQKIIEGEEVRKSKGKGPITNPTIAVVKVRYEQFLDSFKYQKTLQKNYQRTLEKLNELRPMADEIILQVWNEVEQHFNTLPDSDRREKASEYGISYIFRKNEVDKYEESEEQESLIERSKN